MRCKTYVFSYCIFKRKPPENKETAPPKLQPIIETLFLSILGSFESFSKALYASKIIADAVTSTCEPTVELYFCF